MKIYVFESLKLINTLRKRLNNEENISDSLTQTDLNEVEETLLSKLKGHPDHSEAFHSFFKDILAESKLDKNSSEDIQKLLSIPSSPDNVELPNEQTVEDVSNEVELKLPVDTEIPPYVPPTVNVIPVSTPIKVSFFDKFWSHFKDELSVNWFLFLGAFLVFGAGIVYSLMNWVSFSANTQFVYSLCGLMFFAVMEFLLRKFMSLKKSPKVFCYLFFLGAPLVLFLQSKLGILFFGLSLLVIVVVILSASQQYSLSKKQSSFLILLLGLIYPVVYASQVCSPFSLSIAIPLLSIIYLLSKPFKEEDDSEGLSKYFRVFASFYFSVVHFSLFSPVVFTWLLFVFATDFLSRPQIHLQRAGFFYAFFFLFVLVALTNDQSIFLLSGSILFLINLSKMQLHSPHWFRGWIIVVLAQILVFFVPPQMFFVTYKSSLSIFFIVCFIELFGGAALAKFLKLNYRIEVMACLTAILYLLTIVFKAPLYCVPLFSILAIVVFDSKRVLSFVESLIFYLYVSSMLVVNTKFIYFMEFNTLLAFFTMIVFYRLKIQKLNKSALFFFSLVYLIISQLWLYDSSYPRLLDPLYLNLMVFNSIIFWLLLRAKIHQIILPIYLIEKQLLSIAVCNLYFKNESVILALSLCQIGIFLLAHPRVLSLMRSKILDSSILLAKYERDIQKYLSIVCLAFISLFWFQIWCLVPILFLTIVYQLGFLSVISFSLLFVFGLDKTTSVSLDFLALFLTIFYLALYQVNTRNYLSYLGKWREAFTYISYSFSLLFVSFGFGGPWEHTSTLSLFKGSFLSNFIIYWLLFLITFYVLSKRRYHPLLLLYFGAAAALFVLPNLLQLVSIPLFIGAMLSMVLVLEILGPKVVEKHSNSLFITILMAFIMLNLGYSFDATTFTSSDLYGAMLLFVPIFSYLRSKETCYLDSFYILLLVFALFHLSFLYFIVGLFIFSWCAQLFKLKDSKHHLTWCSLLQVALVVALVLQEFSPIILGINFVIIATHVFALSYFLRIQILVDISFILYGCVYLFLKSHGVVGGSVYSSYVLLLLGVVLELLSRLEALHFFKISFIRISRALPLLVMFKESQSSQSPYVYILSGGVYEWFQDSSKLSYTRLLGLLSFNLACFAFVESYELGWEVFSSFLGFSVLWYAKTVQQFCSKEVMILLKITGSFLFYSGFLYEFVMVGDIYQLLFLWLACIVGGLLAIYFEGRIQLYVSTLIFIFSVGFFVIRQIIHQVNMGLPAMMGLGLILMIIGILLEKNKGFFVDFLSRLSKRFKKWNI